MRALVARGVTVRVLDNDSRGSRANLSDLGAGVEMIVGDIRDADLVNKAVASVDIVCHLAAINGTENFYKYPERVLEVGVKGIVNVIDACRVHQTAQLIVMSSSEVYQTPPCVPTDESVPLVVCDPLNPRYSYGSSKIITEMMALHAFTGTRVCVVRPHNVYGPRMGYEHVIPQFITRMIDLAKDTDEFCIQGSGAETRAFCYIDDFVDGFVRVFDNGKSREIYHIGTDQETSIASLAHLVGRCFNRDIQIRATPLQQGSTVRRCPDIAKIRRLGFSPRTSLYDGLMRTTSWYKEFPYKRSADELSKT